MKTFSILLLVATLISTQLHAQSTCGAPDKPMKGANHSENEMTYDVMDNFYDRWGNQYHFEDLIIQETQQTTGGGKTIGQGNSQVNTVSANCGAYFTLHFETGSGMEGSSPVHLSRRAVVCQVFDDLSQFIVSPLSSTGNKVHVYVRDIVNMGLSNPGSSSTAGLGSSYFPIPAVQNAGGIADNLVWQTILSGKDARTNVVNPISTVANIYHGAIGFNFVNTVFNFNYNLGSAPAFNQLDFYPIVLHEALHMMGFGSMISQNGNSSAGATFPYYSRYDSFLKTQSNIPLLSAIPASTCSGVMYNWKWNPSLSTSILAPNTSNCNPGNTTCGSAIMFGPINQHIYTPNCWEQGSSLSHFEDQCAPSGATNNMYFVMSDQAPYGVMKRYPKPEERTALCSIGYSCKANYGNSINLNNFSYGGGTCPGLQVAGINDGIALNGSYQYTGPISVFTTLSPGILTNDQFVNPLSPNNTSICHEVLIGSGTFLGAGNTLQYKPASAGFHLIRYIPKDGTTNRQGNITYIYFYVPSGNCTPNTCDIVNNGGFENGTGCGTGNFGIDCWAPYAGTPDYFVRNCSQTGYSVPTTLSNPPADTWDAVNPLNNKFIGLWGFYMAGNNYGEACQMVLSSNLIPSTTYNLTFRARVASNFSGNTPATLVFGGQVGMQVPSSICFNSMPGVTQLASTVVAANNQWNSYSMNFTVPNGPSLNHLSIILARWSMSGDAYVFIDDVSILPQGNNITLTLPPTICQFDKIPNLGLYASAPGGIFTGPGVSFNSSSGFYEFNATTAGPVQIIHKVTTVNNCTLTASSNITVLANPVPVINAQSLVICAGVSNTLNVTGPATYSWLPTGSGPNNAPLIVNLPLVNTTYTVIGTNPSGCTNSAVVTLTPGAVIPLSAPDVTLCTDMTNCTTITAITSFSPPPTIVWQPISVTNVSAVVCPTVNTIYTVTATSPGACVAQLTMQVTTMTCCPSPTPFFSLPSFTNCNANYTNLQQYVTVPGCSFTGQGVTLTGGQYDFNLSQTLQGGYYNIQATYTTAPWGCTYNSDLWVYVWNGGVSFSYPIYHCGYSQGSILTATVPGGTSYTWSPGGVSTTGSISVAPVVSTVYTITAAAPGCTPSATFSVTVQWNCCPQQSVVTTLPPTTVQAGQPTSFLNGPLVLNGLEITGPGDFTLQAGDFIMEMMTKITVKNGANLILSDAHLWGCPTLWQGIVVENGGKVTSAPGALPSAIEGAQIAIDIDGAASGHAVPIVDLDGVIFNKNWYGISVKNSALNNIPLNVRSCVFTYRDIPFSPPLSPPSWPSTSTLPGGLRYDNGISATSLSPPFLLGTSNYAHAAGNIQATGIHIASVGTNVTGLPGGPGVDITTWAQPSPNEFNLFDHLQIGIYIDDGSLTTSNNAFQFMGLSSIWYTASTLYNARLDLAPLSSSNPATGNRFWINSWNATQYNMGGWPPQGIRANDLFELTVEHNTFRGFGGNWGAINCNSNRFHYYIRNNRFSNVSSGVSCSFYSGPHIFGVNNMPSGVYSSLFDVSQNFFGPQIDSWTTVTNEVLGSGITVTGINGPSYLQSQFNVIQSNIIDRVSWSAISVTDMSYLVMDISNNFVNTMYNGIEVSGSLYAKSIRDNRVFGSNPWGSCYLFKDNWQPEITCNYATGGENGFDFTNDNTGIWTNNTMSGNQVGLRIRGANGALGTQGNSSTPSGNMWSGTWGGTTWETMLDPSTNAWNSILWVSPGPPYEPMTNTGGSPGYAPSIALLPASGDPPSCTYYTYPGLPSPRPENPNGDPVAIKGLSQEANIEMFPNPTSGKLYIKTPGETDQFEFIVADMAGKLVTKQMVSSVDHVVEMDLPLAEGMYMITLVDRSGKTQRTKLVVTK